MTTDQALFRELVEPTQDGARERVIHAVDVHKVYRAGTQETHALRGATLEIFRGEYLSIMGPSGSGKSTSASRDVPSISR